PTPTPTPTPTSYYTPWGGSPSPAPTPTPTPTPTSYYTPWGSSPSPAPTPTPTPTPTSYYTPWGGSPSPAPTPAPTPTPTPTPTSYYTSWGSSPSPAPTPTPSASYDYASWGGSPAPTPTPSVTASSQAPRNSPTLTPTPVWSPGIFSWETLPVVDTPTPTPTPSVSLVFNSVSTESQLEQAVDDSYEAYVNSRNGNEVRERLEDYPFAENVYIPDTATDTELLEVHVQAQQDLRVHREELVQTYVNESVNPPLVYSPEYLESDSYAELQAERTAELERLTGVLDIDDQTVIDAADAMSRGIAVEDTEIPEFLIPHDYQQDGLAATSRDAMNYVGAFGLDGTAEAEELETNIEIRAAGTMAEYFDVFDHPNGGTDRLAYEEDIFELATGEYDDELVRERLMETYGVPEDELDAEIARIEWAARELQQNEELRDAIDVGSGEGGVDGKTGILDVQVWTMDATAGRTDTDSLAIREQIITWHIPEDPALDVGDNVARIALGESRLGPLSDAEQDLVIETALDRWSGSEYAEIRDWEPLGGFIREIADGEDQDLLRRTTDAYFDRAIELVSPEQGETATEQQRRDAATLSSLAMYELATQEDTELIADVINDRTPEEIYALVDSLEFNNDTNLFTNPWPGPSADTRVFSATGLVMRLSETPTTEQTDALTLGVFYQLSGDDYPASEPLEQQFASVITRNWTGTGESHDEATDRIAGVLGTSQGRDLLAYNENIPASDRLTMLQLFADNADWDADMLRSHDGNGWTNPTVMTAYAQPIAQDYADLLGDDPISLEGFSLHNTIGFAIGLPVDENLRGTAEEIAAGEANAYTENSVIVDAVASSIQEFAGQGNTPEVTVLPVMFSDGNSPPRVVPLFRVTVGENEHYVDAAGGVYDDFNEWETESELPSGNFTYPTDGHLTVDAEGVVELSSDNTPKTIDTTGERVANWLDTGAQVGGLVAGGVLIVGTGGAATPFVVGVAVASGGWTAYRAADRLATSVDRGRSIDPINDANARGDWLDFATGVLGVAAAGGQVLNATSRGARGAGLVRGLSGAAEVADTAATVNDAHTLITEWDNLSASDRALLAVSIAFWGAERIAPSATGPDATIDNAVTVDEDGNVTVNPLAEDAPDWAVAMADGATIPDFIPIENYVASARTIDGGLPALVASAEASGRLPELIESGALTRNDLQYLRITGAIDGDAARAAVSARDATSPDTDETTLRFADDDMDSFNVAANSALPNTTYEWGNYAWTTDEFGRVSSVEGEIELETIGRNDSTLQTAIGNEGLEYDVGFHIVADRFGAPINRLNVVPGNGQRIPGDSVPNLNGSAWRIFENQMAKIAAAAESDPDLSPPEINITMEYNDGNTSARPDRFVVQWRTDSDAAWVRTVFDNKFEAPANSNE
nr:DUF4781 domain-containing protein [Gammaproteobacteria bacterium]